MAWHQGDLSRCHALSNNCLDKVRTVPDEKRDLPEDRKNCVFETIGWRLSSAGG